MYVLCQYFQAYNYGVLVDAIMFQVVELQRPRPSNHVYDTLGRG